MNDNAVLQETLANRDLFAKVLVSETDAVVAPLLRLDERARASIIALVAPPAPHGLPSARVVIQPGPSETISTRSCPSCILTAPHCSPACERPPRRIGRLRLNAGVVPRPASDEGAATSGSSRGSGRWRLRWPRSTRCSRLLGACDCLRPSRRSAARPHQPEPMRLSPRLSRTCLPRHVSRRRGPCPGRPACRAHCAPTPYAAPVQDRFIRSRGLRRRRRGRLSPPRLRFLSQTPTMTSSVRCTRLRISRAPTAARDFLVGGSAVRRAMSSRGETRGCGCVTCPLPSPAPPGIARSS